MADQHAFFDVLDIMETEKVVDPKRFFNLMRSSFSITHLLYVDVDAQASGLGIHRLHHTMAGPEVKGHVQGELNRIGPALRSMVGRIRPVDWATARQRDDGSKPLFLSAGAFRPDSDGLTLPLASPSRRLAFLAIEANVPTDAWQAYRRCHLRDFQLLANLFHASMLENDNAPPAGNEGSTALTHRETEVLRWAAAGKSYWEIGTILGISERTVRFFMTNARRKLNVVSNTQAVAQAVRHDLIPTI